MVLDAGRGPEPPCIAILTEYRATYRGRAVAKGAGGQAAVLAKADGSLIVHDPAGGVKPLYYNPPGNLQAWIRLGRWYFRATSGAGETLTVSGMPSGQMSPESALAPRRRRVRQTERDLSDWLASKPRGVRLPRGRPDREALHGGGRVDLLFSDGTVVEVKKRATVAAYDQAQRYLRGGAPRVVIACHHASPRLAALCDASDLISLLYIWGGAGDGPGRR